MHCAPADGQRALQPLRVATPLQGIPCSSRHNSGSIWVSWIRLNSLIVLTLRLRGHSSQTVELPAPIVAPLGGSSAFPFNAAITRSTTAAIWWLSGGQPG